MTEKTFSVANLVKTLNLDELVKTIKECDQSEKIEKNILDYRWHKSLMHKSLLPLYIVWKYYGSVCDLSSGEITRVLQKLGLTLKWPHVSRGLRDAKNYVQSDKEWGTGQRMRFSISRPGALYLEEIIKGKSSNAVEVRGAIIPPETVAGTRKYIEQMVLEINGSYECSWYDAAAVMCRRLMESLIIEVYISQNRQNEIKSGGAYLTLEKLIDRISADQSVSLGRSTLKDMKDIKELGDTAAHHRTYITLQPDIDEARTKIRKVILELLALSGIRK
jgi:hypothetical protein